MGRVFLVGADGFLGSAVRAALEQAGHGVEAAPPVERLDLLDLGVAGIAELLRGTGDAGRGEPVVVNCAGVVAGSPELLERANIRLPEALAAACADDLPLIHLGSAAEYGTLAAGTSVREDDPTRPGTPYGRTKLAGTQAVLAGCPRAIVLRIFNPLGPGQPTTTLPGRLLAAVRAGDPEITTGPLGAYRDFVSTWDIARAVVAAVERGGSGEVLGEVINVASGRAVQLREVAAQFCTRSGSGLLVHEEAGEGEDRSQVDWSQGDVGAAAGLLGWKPEDDLAAAVDRMLA